MCQYLNYTYTRKLPWHLMTIPLCPYVRQERWTPQPCKSQICLGLFATRWWWLLIHQHTQKHYSDHWLLWSLTVVLNMWWWTYPVETDLLWIRFIFHLCTTIIKTSAVWLLAIGPIFGEGQRQITQKPVNIPWNKKKHKVLVEQTQPRHT